MFFNHENLVGEDSSSWEFSGVILLCMPHIFYSLHQCISLGVFPPIPFFIILVVDFTFNFAHGMQHLNSEFFVADAYVVNVVLYTMVHIYNYTVFKLMERKCEKTMLPYYSEILVLAGVVSYPIFETSIAPIFTSSLVFFNGFYMVFFDLSYWERIGCCVLFTGATVMFSVEIFLIQNHPIGIYLPFEYSTFSYGDLVHSGAHAFLVGGIFVIYSSIIIPVFLQRDIPENKKVSSWNGLENDIETQKENCSKGQLEIADGTVSERNVEDQTEKCSNPEAEAPLRSVKGCGRTGLKVRSSRKSVRFADDVKTSQANPEAGVEDPSHSTQEVDKQAADPPRLSAFKIFSQSVASLFRSVSDDVKGSEPSSESPLSMDYFSSESPLPVVLSSNSNETSNSDDRSVSSPEAMDADRFYVGEEVEYRGKAKWKRGIVHSISPLTVKGQGNMRAKKYEQVRKRRTKPRTQRELLEMDASEMTREDYRNLMKGARRNTLFGRSALIKSMQSRSALVDTITKA